MRVILCIISSLGWLSAAWALSSNRPMDEALEGLGNPDPRVRATAARTIESEGQAARPALISASQSRDRLLAGQAADLLMKLPFHRSDDPPSVRALLADYHTQPPEQRIQTIAGAILRVKETPQLLCRLMNEDPDDQVAWFIGDLYAGQRDDFWKPLLTCDLASARPAVRATVARGVFFSDRAKARELLRQVAAEEATYSSAPPEKLQEICLLLAADAQVTGNLAEALRYRRRVADFPFAIPLTVDGEELAEASPLTGLLAFYAGVGMVQGFGEDLANHWEDIPLPENLYGLSRVFSCPGLTPVSSALERLGDASLPADIDQRIAIGELAAGHQWASPTIRILDDAARRSVAPADDRANLARRWRCLSWLYMISKETGDEVAAIRYSNETLQGMRQLQVDATSRELEGRLLGHQIQLARQKQDKAALRTVVESAVKLVDAGGLDADSGAAAVNALRDLGDDKRAQAVFQKLFLQHQEIVTQSEDDATALNNLAWLCASVGQKVDLAVDASERAIRAQPAEFGSIDTAALANFRAGNVARAIELELFALALHPNDQFLIRQLEMFRASPGK